MGHKMTFDVDIEYVKGISIPYVEALSKMWFYKLSKDKTEEIEDIFLHRVETNVLSLDRMAAETSLAPVLSNITSRIRKTYGEIVRGCKEIRHKLTIEYAGISNGVLIISPETQRKLLIKSVHDDIHCRVAAIQEMIKLEV